MAAIVAGLAYLGALLGLPTVDRAVADADLRGFVEALLRELDKLAA